MIVSHTRTGTHLLAKLLYQNVELRVDDYEKLHYSHSRIAPFPYVHLHRQLLPTMVSIWKCREHLGIAAKVSFSDMVRTPWPKMPKSESCEVYFNGERCNKVCMSRPFATTLPERWLALTREFEKHCAVSVAYDAVVSLPRLTVQRVCNRLALAPKATFSPVTQRVGWYPVKDEKPVITQADKSYLESYQCQLLL